MRSLILGSSAVALLIAAPASADQAVTTGETDDSGFPNYALVIVKPEDGAVIEGNPDAVVQVTIEHENLNWVWLSVDGGPATDCPDVSPCMIEVTLAPGLHQLEATGEADVFADQHVITIEVVDAGSATEGPASASVTDSDSDTGSSETAATDTGATTADSDGETAATSPTSSATDPAPGGTDGTAGNDGTDGTAGTDSTGGGGGSGDKEGCGCTTRPGAPDLLGLALFALVAPWRRRRRA